MGSKAAVLARLSENGFAVPEGYVIGVEVLSTWPPNTPAPPHVVSEVERAVAMLGPGPYAVRSSAVEEDGATASFAGMYTTTLGVEGVGGVLDAIAATLESAMAAPVVAYSGAARPEMAILIQPMLDPAAAGIAFTADPVSGDRATVRVSGVRGLGDAVADGTVTPDEWDVTDGIPRRRSDSGVEALGESQVKQIARVAMDIEAVQGAPQDVEWAIVDDVVVVLQARPITALPSPPTDRLDGANWEKDTAHYPEQLTAFGWSLVAGDRIGRVFARYGLLIDGLESRLIGGEVYVRPDPVIGSADSSAKPPPAWVLGLASRAVPALRKRMSAAQAAVEAGLDTLPRRWSDVERQDFLDRLDELRAIDPASLDTDSFVAHLDAIRAVMADGAESHFNIAVPYFVFLHEFATTMESSLGWTFDQSVALLDSPASRPTSDLDPIRSALAADDEARTALLANPSDPVGAIGSVHPALAIRLKEWIDRNGWRTSGYDAGSPALIERPGLITRLLVSSHEAPAASTVETELSRALEGMAAEDRENVEKALELARWIYPMREDNVIIVDNLPSGLARRWLLEAGTRLRQRDLIARRDDAAHLEANEIVDALTDTDDASSPSRLRDIVAKRRSEWAWVTAHPGPKFVGKRTPPPDVSRLPAAGRRLNGALLWAMSHEYPADVAQQDDAHLLRGSPGSAGTYTGTVRIVRGESDFAKVRPGDVLVCPVTTPAWTVLFPLIGALVTDGGGVLSHAAIVAREHGVPAVLGTGVATHALSDGQLVSVDGTAGKVEIH